MPKFKLGECRNIRLVLRLTKSESNILKKVAFKNKLDISKFVRMAINKEINNEKITFK